MNTTYCSQKGDPGNVRHSGEEIQESIYPNHHETNISDGAEFLDDGTRMKDQPLAETNTDEMDDPLQNTYE
jgi:hypothetical protein